MLSKILTIIILWLCINHGNYALALVDPVFTLEEVLVRSKRILSNFDITPFKNTIYQSRYKGMFKSTSEIISHSLSAQVKSTGGTGQAETVSIRGVNSGQVEIFLDNVRLNGLNGGGFDLSLIPLNFLEKIEIFRGGFSGEFGLDALGGVIRLKTKTEKGMAHYGISYSNGSFSTNKLNLSVLNNIGNYNLLFEAQALGTDGKFLFLNYKATMSKEDDAFQIRENNYSKSQNVLFKLSNKESDKKEVNYLLEYSRINRGIAGIITFPSDTSNEKKSLIINQVNIKNYFKKIEMGLDFGHKLSTLYFQDKEGDLTGVPIETSQKEEAFNLGLYLRRELNTGNILTAKYEYCYQKLTDINFGAPHRIINSLLLKDEKTFQNGKYLFSGQVRLDLFKDSHEINDTRKYFQANPHLSAFYEIYKNISLKTNFGRSYRLPNFSELYLNQGLIIGNPDLKNEKAWHYDIGLEYNTDKVKSQISYFYENLTDAIQFVLISGFRFKPLNVEKAKISGIEFGSDYKINKYLSLGIFYNYLRAIDKTGRPNQDGMQLVGRPRHKIDLNLNCNIYKCKILFDLGFLSGNYLTQANTKYIPRRYDFSMSTIFDIKKNVNISIDIKNILNRHDYDLRGFPLPGRSIYSTLNINW